MGEAKFTKGEWELNKKCHEPCNWQIDMIRNDGRENYKHHNVIEIAVRMDYQDSNEEMEANAHLIKVAPKMYKMLEEVLSEYKEMFGMSREVSEIEGLLAEARGES